MALPGPLTLLKETFQEWNEDKASRLAAALAYYTAFSIAPLVLLAIAITGILLGEKAAQGTVFAQLEGLLGPETAAAIEGAVTNSQKPGANALSAVIGLLTLVWSAGNVFGQLQDALNTIWEVKPKPTSLVGTVKRRFVPLSLVFGIGFLLLVSLVLSAGLAAVGQFFNHLLPGSEIVWQVLNFIFSLVVISFLFAGMYKYLPDVTIAWKDVWAGAAVTALLFTIGKTLIGLYLGHASVGSTYGAAGSLLVFLVWVYYSAQILFFGAEFTQVYAHHRGSQIVPTKDALPLTKEARAQQGAPREEDQAGASGVDHGDDQRPAPTERASSTAPNLRVEAQSLDRDPSVLKKLLWAGLTSGALALVGVGAHLLTGRIWRGLFHEPPPGGRG